MWLGFHKKSVTIFIWVNCIALLRNLGLTFILRTLVNTTLRLFVPRAPLSKKMSKKDHKTNLLCKQCYCMKLIPVIHLPVMWKLNHVVRKIREIEVQCCWVRNHCKLPAEIKYKNSLIGKRFSQVFSPLLNVLSPKDPFPPIHSSVATCIHIYKNAKGLVVRSKRNSSLKELCSSIFISFFLFFLTCKVKTEYITFFPVLYSLLNWWFNPKKVSQKSSALFW